MAVAEAHAILPRLDLHEEDVDADVRALRQLAQWPQRYSPIVGSEDEPSPQSLLVDITECAAFHGEGRPVSIPYDSSNRMNTGTRNSWPAVRSR
jgi:hypothetical protein